MKNSWKYLLIKLESLVQRFHSLSILTKAVSLTLVVMLTVTAVILPHIGSTMAEDVDNDTNQTNYMNSMTVSGSPDYTAGGYNLSGKWRDYLNEQWRTTCQNKFQWTDVSALNLPAWDGSTASVLNSNQNDPQTNAAMIPYLDGGSTYEIWSGQQLRWVLNQTAAALNGKTIKLMRNLDLDGKEQNWTSAATVLTTVTLDGNGKTIYNLGIYQSSAYNGGFVAQLTGSTVKDLTFVSAKMVKTNNTGYFSLFGRLTSQETPTADNMCTFTNVNVKNSLIFHGGDGGCAFLFSSSGGTYQAARKPDYYNMIEHCSVTNSYAYGMNHVAALAAFTSDSSFDYCYATDTTVVSTGYHSGGLISCYDGYAQASNCFTNVTVYGSAVTGVFVGSVGGGGIYKNCYASGYIEGVTQLGGFAGSIGTGYYLASVTVDFGQVQMINCYSTSIVGMQNGGTALGGFVGRLSQSGVTPNSILIQNCYAAGEVGSVDTDVTPGRQTFMDVGGFYGTSGITTVPLIFTDNYYDKQTTAMREWASGSSQTVKNTPDNGAVNTITGLLTQDTAKSGAGLVGTSTKAGLDTANGWVSMDNLYPQLDVFANPENYPDDWGTDPSLLNLVKAYSQASVSTVFCDNYKTTYNGSAQTDPKVYDTVRDLTQQVPMTASDNTVWSKGNNAIGSDTDPTVLLYGKTLNVCYLMQSGDQFTATDFAPGIQWLTVQVTVGDQVGTRSLRLIPTANLNVGETQTIAVGGIYNHGVDVNMAYSTGPRMAVNNADITTGALLTAASTDYLAVNVGYMDGGIPSNASYSSSGPGGVMYVTSAQADLTNGDGTPIDQMFNGERPFTAAQIGNYTLVYNWVLKDARYLTDSKNVIVGGTQVSLPLDNQIKYTGYDMSNNINGNTNMDQKASDPATAGDGLYFGNIYLEDGYVWYTPYDSDEVIKQDAITGQITGYPLSSATDAVTGKPLDASATTGATKYHGPPAYDGRYLWFSPYNSDYLLRVDPLAPDGGIVGYYVANTLTGYGPYNGNSNITGSSSDPAKDGVKYSQAVFANGYIWLIPFAGKESLLRVDPATGTMTGFPLLSTDPGMTDAAANVTNKYEAAAYDGTNLWIAPYNSDRLLKVDISSPSTPVFTGYDFSPSSSNMTIGSGMDMNSSTGVGDPLSNSAYGILAKFHGCIFDGTDIWLIPAMGTRLVKVSDINGDKPAVTGYALTNGTNGNVGMDDTYAAVTLRVKYPYPAFDGKYIWMPPNAASKLVRVDISNGQMTGYTLPEYKSMTDDVPYVNSPDPTDSFHNYFNNNNWGMTDLSSSYGTSTATLMYYSICFDGDNLWLCPRKSDRIVKISPSVDEKLTLSGSIVTADLTNYMTQVNPYTGMTPTIDKIEWLRVDTADTPNLTYKGNSLSPYTDTQNSISTTATANSEFFDYMYSQASTVDKGVVYANDYGDQMMQQLSFAASQNGTYYVKAYFTDPVNYYGMDQVYNAERGTPQMVCVIKEIDVKLTGTLYVRQAVIGTIPSGLPVPDTGYMKLTDTTTTAMAGITVPSGISTSAAFAQFTLKTDDDYTLADIIPQYYKYAGYTLTTTGDGSDHTDTPVSTGTNIAFSASTNNYITVYIEPVTDNPGDNETSAATNVFSKNFGAILTDDFPNFPTPPDFGDNFTKAIGAKNTQQTDAFVRIVVTPVLIASDGTLLNATLGDSPDDTIIVDMNKTDWAYGGDGYWYYLKVLKPGQSTENLFNTVTINNNLGDQYKGAELTIQVKCEASGTDTEAYQMSFWGKVGAPDNAILADIDSALQEALQKN